MSGKKSLLKVLRPVCCSTTSNIGGASRSVVDVIQAKLLHPKSALKTRSNEAIPTPLPRRFADKKDHGNRREKKKKTEETEKKMVMKEWTEQSPGWLGRDPGESDLVKHIEVLQRFADRYNTACGEPPDKTKTEMTEEGRKRLMKILDKQPSKKFSTFVRLMEKKRQAQILHKDRSGVSKSFITLAKEPRKSLATAPKAKPIVPVVKHFQNPDSILLTSFLGQQESSKPRLYSIVNPKFKNKAFEAYLRKTFLSGPNSEKVKDKKIPEPTIGEYFTDRYYKKPDSGKEEVKSGPNVSSKLQDSLVEGRRTSSSFGKQRTITAPALHPKTSLLVQKTHLPLALCKKVRPAKNENPELPTNEPKKPPPAKPADVKPEEAKKTAKRDQTLLNKLMTYFKK